MHQHNHGLFVVSPRDRSRLNHAKRFFKAHGSDYQAVSTTKALKLASSGTRPSVIMVDHSMPMDCRASFLRLLQAMPALGDIPIVMSIRLPDERPRPQEVSSMRATEPMSTKKGNGETAVAESVGA